MTMHSAQIHGIPWGVKRSSGFLMGMAQLGLLVVTCIYLVSFAEGVYDYQVFVYGQRYDSGTQTKVVKPNMILAQARNGIEMECIPLTHFPSPFPKFRYTVPYEVAGTTDVVDLAARERMEEIRIWLYWKGVNIRYRIGNTQKANCNWVTTFVKVSLHQKMVEKVPKNFTFGVAPVPSSEEVVLPVGEQTFQYCRIPGSRCSIVNDNFEKCEPKQSTTTKSCPSQTCPPCVQTTCPSVSTTTCIPCVCTPCEVCEFGSCEANWNEGNRKCNEACDTIVAKLSAEHTKLMMEKMELEGRLKGNLRRKRAVDTVGGGHWHEYCIKNRVAYGAIAATLTTGFILGVATMVLVSYYRKKFSTQGSNPLTKS